MIHPGIGRKTKALIAGGAEKICKRLQHELKKKGCEVEYITSPLGVIERLHDARGEGKPYELLLLDLRMPTASGFELLKEIRGAQPDLDIITGYGDEDKAIEAIRLGASDYLQKPISLEDLHTALFRSQQKRAAEAGQTLRHTILVVDDDEDLCKCAKRELDKEGYETAVAYDGVEGLDYFKNNHVDVIIADIRMPGMDGLAMLEACWEITGDFVSIIITGHGDRETAIEALKLGVLNYLKKPVSLKELVISVDKGTEILFLRRSLLARRRELEIAVAIKEQYAKNLEKLVEERTKALRENEKKFRSICAAAQDAIIMMDNEGNISYWNEAAEQIFGYSSREVLGQEVHILLAPTRYHEAYRGGFSRFKATGQGPAVGKTLELAAMKKDGTEFPIELSVSAVNLEGKWSAIGILRDITGRKQAEERLLKVKTELEEMNRRLQENQAQLVQSEKMASIGQLAAGVAHEINNPIGFINSNLTTLDEYRRDLTALINNYLELEQLATKNPALSNNQDLVSILETIRNLKEKMDMDFVLGDFDKVIAESREGTERIKKIVWDLKDFSHVDQAELKYTDLNKGLDSTLNIVWNEIKYKATVTRDYSDIPEVYCYPQQVNQVFMNILVNAAQAIEDKGEIKISTAFIDGAEPMVEIRISDTGKGIPPENLPRIFDAFFTTKPVGKGTGLGLSMAYSIIKKHDGGIKVESEVGKGTTFIIQLPVSGPKGSETPEGNTDYAG